MSSVELNPRPLRVSPLIKFTRWTLLGFGIIYGAFHHNRYSKIETARREQEERERPAREAKLALEKKLAVEAEIKYLEEVTSGSK